MGQCIAIKHNGDAVSIYKNVSAELPKGIIEGAKVKAGQQIATVGSTAMVEIADEPHLHFEMTVGGLAVDPLEYFSSNDVETLQKERYPLYREICDLQIDNINLEEAVLALESIDENISD